MPAEQKVLGTTIFPELKLADCGFACLSERACWCESELEHTEMHACTWAKGGNCQEGINSCKL